MKITVQLFGTLRNRCDANDDNYKFLVEFTKGMDVKCALNSAGISESKKCIVSINHRVVGLDDLIADGDVLKIFPLVSGG